MASTPKASSSGASAETRALLGALPDLVPLRAPLSNGALKGDSLPTRIKLMGWGDNSSIKGNFKIGPTSLAVLSANQRRLGYERVALDLDHCSMQGSPEHERMLKLGQPPIIFGYGRPTVVQGDGLYLDEMEYTPLGAQSARNFSDLSPAVKDVDGEVVFVGSVALTTNGCLDGVTFFSAAVKQGTVFMNDMNKNSQIDTDKIITVQEMASLVGLGETATKADVLGKLSVLSAVDVLSGLVKDGKVILLDTVSAIDSRLKAVEAAGTKSLALLSATVDGKVVTFTAEDVVRLGAKVTGLESALNQQLKAGEDVERNNLVLLFAKDGKSPKNSEGKEYSADELKKLDLATLKLLHANTPVTVPLSARSQRFMGGDNASAQGFASSVRSHVSAGKTRAQAVDLAIKENAAGYAAWRAANGQPGI